MTRKIILGLLIILSLFIASKRAFAQTEVVDFFIQGGKGMKKNILSDPQVMVEIDHDQATQIAQMRFSGTGAWDSTPWEPYSALKMWTFTADEGQKSLFAQFKLSGGETVPVSKTFILDQSPPNVQFSLKTKTIGYNSIKEIIADVSGGDDWSNYLSYRMNYKDEFNDTPWNSLLTNQPKLIFSRWDNGQYLEKEDGEIVSVAFQARDEAGNTTPVMYDSFTLDLTSPILYVKAQPSDSLTTKLEIEARDAHSAISSVHLYNNLEKIRKYNNDDLVYDDDKLYSSQGVRKPYESLITWKFGPERLVVVGVIDSAGNRSEPVAVTLPDVTATPQPLDPSPSFAISPYPTDVTVDPDYQNFQDKLAQLEQIQTQQKEKVAQVEESLHVTQQAVATQQSLIARILAIFRNLWPFKL